MSGYQESPMLEDAQNVNPTILTREEKARKRSSDYYYNHREECLIKNKLWRTKEGAKEKRKKYLEDRPEQRKQENKRYREKYSDKIKESLKISYQKNKEIIIKNALTDRIKNPEKHLFFGARRRAKERNIPFSIKKEDIYIPDSCPLLNIPLLRGTKKLCDNSPTLDRIVLNLGYVKNNIMVISYKANRMKSNSTFEEFETIYKNLKLIMEGKNG